MSALRSASVMALPWASVLGSVSAWKLESA
jgi:hypothetical protein